jgi:tetraacyldisaccharide-1-P 4'-kinase
MLDAAGWRVARRLALGAHHWFTPADLDRLVRAAREAGASAVVTTEKDFVRLLPFRPFRVPVVALPLQLTIEPLSFFDWLLARLAAARSAATEQPA